MPPRFGGKPATHGQAPDRSPGGHNVELVAVPPHVIGRTARSRPRSCRIVEALALVALARRRDNADCPDLVIVPTSGLISLCGRAIGGGEVGTIPRLARMLTSARC